MRLRVVTGNPGKLAELRRLLVAGGLELEAAPLELLEIQSLDLVEVARAKAVAAGERAEGPLLVDDTALELAALGGFPGPLVKWLLASVGATGIARLTASLGDDRAVARCVLVLRDGDREIVANGATAGRIVAPRGGDGFGWDPVFAPDGGCGRTYAELTSEEKDRLGHRGAACRELAARLRSGALRT